MPHCIATRSGVFGWYCEAHETDNGIGSGNAPWLTQ